MRARIAVAVGMSFMLLVVLAPMARADWVPGQPAKWVQLPDLTSQGMDVNATWNGGWPFVKVLADDFLCTQTGPITDVHIWGSWLNDVIDPNVMFKLSIHADVPAGVTPYSHPGEQLWSRVFAPGEYLMRPWAIAEERFFEPNTNEVIGFDNQVFQFNFLMDPADPTVFVQQGTSALPKVYWLDVQAMTNTGAVFGWKTSAQHWNDDATFADTPGFGVPPSDWHELIGPDGQSLDMSFVITPEPATLCLIGLGAVGMLVRRRRK